MERTIAIVLKFIDQATGPLKQATEGVETAVRGIKNYLSDLVAHAKWASFLFGTLLVGAIGKAVGEAAKFERFAIAAEALAGSKEEADRFIQSTKRLARETMFGVDQIAEMNMRLLGQTKNVALSERALRGLATVVQATGGGFDQLQGTVRAWIQTFIKARASAEEINRQFANANIPVMRIMAEAIEKDVNHPLRKYIQTTTTAGGVSKELARAHEKAVERVKWLGAEIENAKDKLADWEKSGKKTEYQLNSLRLAIQKKEAALEEANNTIAKYNAAQSQATVTTKLTTKQIMAQLANLRELKIPGEEFALALLDAIDKEKTFQEVTIKMRGTVSYQLEKLRDNFKLLILSLIGLDENWRPVEKGFMSLLKNALIPLNNWLEKNEKRLVEFSEALGKSTPALVGFGAFIVGVLFPAFGGLILRLGVAGALFAGFGVAVGLLTTLLKKNAAAFWAIVGAIGALGVAWTAAKLPAIIGLLTQIGTALSILLNPLTLIMMAVGALAGIMIADWGKIGNVITALKDTLIDMFQTWVKTVHPAVEEISNAFNIISGVFGVLIENIKNTFTPVWDEVIRLFGELREPLRQVWQQIVQLWGAIVPVVEIIGTFFIAVLGALGGVLIIVIGIFQSFINGILLALPSLIAFIIGIFQTLISFFQMFWGLVMGLFTGNWTTLQQGWQNLCNAVMLIIGSFVETVIGLIGGFIASIYNYFKNLWDWLVGGSLIPELVNAIITWFTNLAGQLIGLIGEMIAKLVQLFGEGKTKLLEKIGQIIGGITSAFQGLVSAAYDWGRGIVENIINGIREAIRAARRIAGGLASKLMETIGVSAAWVGFQHGGIIPGPIGAPMPIIAHGGERIVPRGGVERGFGQPIININISGSFNLDDPARLRDLANLIGRVLGRQMELAQLGAGW